MLVGCNKETQRGETRADCGVGTSLARPRRTASLAQWWRARIRFRNALASMEVEGRVRRQSGLVLAQTRKSRAIRARMAFKSRDGCLGIKAPELQAQRPIATQL